MSFKLPLFLTIFLIIFTLSFCYSPSLAPFCDGRILDPDHQMTRQDINFLCNRIRSDNRFLISLQRSINIPSITNENYYYTKATEDLFRSNCGKFNMCSNGYLISVYTDRRKIRISAGSESSKAASVSDRNRVIEEMKPYLKNNKFADAFIRSVDMLKGFRVPNSTIRPMPIPHNNPYTPHEGYHTHRRHESEMGFWSFFFFILVPICLCCVCMYFMCKKNQEQEEKRISLSQEAGYIHDHIIKLENLMNQIKSYNPPVIRVDYCLICLNNINFMTPAANQLPNYNQLNDTNDENTRYDCDHVYHTNCLSQRNINYCLMCKSDKTASTRIPNQSNFQIIDDACVKMMIANLHMIYPREQLTYYSTAYPEQYHSYNSVIIISGPGPYYGGGGYYGYNDGYYNCGGGNEYNAYEQGYNAAQQDNNNNFNNNDYVDTAGGDYGGYTDTAGGDYGGGDDGDY